MEQMWVGRKVRLRAVRPEDHAIFQPLFDDSDMESSGFGVRWPHSLERARKRLEKEWDEEQNDYDDHWLIIETLEARQPIGIVGLKDADSRHRTAEIGISLMDRAAWGHGYGSEAMRLLLRFAFRELDYAKINLTMIDGNTRAVALYEHLGFQHEGRRRSQYYAAGRRWDELFMGLTRAEYEAQHAAWFPDEAMSVT